MIRKNKNTIQKLWDFANKRDWQGFSSLLGENIVYEIPQTRERVTGREAYTEFNATYPGDWLIEIDKIIADENQGFSQVTFKVQAEVMIGISVFEFKEGLITHISDFWPENYEPPDRKFDRIERY